MLTCSVIPAAAGFCSVEIRIMVPIFLVYVTILTGAVGWILFADCSSAQNSMDDGWLCNV